MDEKFNILNEELNTDSESTESDLNSEYYIEDSDSESESVSETDSTPESTHNSITKLNNENKFMSNKNNIDNEIIITLSSEKCIHENKIIHFKKKMLNVITNDHFTINEILTIHSIFNYNKKCLFNRNKILNEYILINILLNCFDIIIISNTTKILPTIPWNNNSKKYQKNYDEIISKYDFKEFIKNNKCNDFNMKDSTRIIKGVVNGFVFYIKNIILLKKLNEEVFKLNDKDENNKFISDITKNIKEKYFKKSSTNELKEFKIIFKDYFKTYFKTNFKNINEIIDNFIIIIKKKNFNTISDEDIYKFKENIINKVKEKEFNFCTENEICEFKNIFISNSELMFCKDKNIQIVSNWLTNLVKRILLFNLSEFVIKNKTDIIFKKSLEEEIYIIINIIFYLIIILTDNTKLEKKKIKYENLKTFLIFNYQDTIIKNILENKIFKTIIGYIYKNKNKKKFLSKKVYISNINKNFL